MDEYYEVGHKRYCEKHIGEVMVGSGGKGRLDIGRAEKRRTRLVDMGQAMGGFGGLR